MLFAAVNDARLSRSRQAAYCPEPGSSTCQGRKPEQAKAHWQTAERERVTLALARNRHAGRDRDARSRLAETLKRASAPRKKAIKKYKIIRCKRPGNENQASETMRQIYLALTFISVVALVFVSLVILDRVLG
jgi:hypothetical protein